jgi:GTPase
VFHDRARIWVEGGRGGNGVVSFRREAHVPRGGPDGGDGGRGGDVVLVCDPSRRDLAELRIGRHFRADRGEHGRGKQQHGARGSNREVLVPPGTSVEAADGSSYDLTEPGQRAVVAAGGEGGHGNKRFTTSTRQAPRFAEQGLPGDEGWIELRLRLLADAGLVGLPNAGKSSLLAALTRARPKVADYPFTTIDPILGTIDDGERQLVLADIPGLIEGAAEGAGLGHEFLAHVERTRLLVHVVELAPPDGPAAAERAHATVRAELARHAAGLEALPELVCLSKADLLPAERVEEEVERWRGGAGGSAVAVVATSAATGAGLDALARAIDAHIPDAPPPVPGPGLDGPAAEHRVYRPGADESFRVERLGDRAYRVTGGRVERLIARHDLGNEEALRYIEDRLRGLGVIRALEAAGFEPGDDVEIGGTVFELDPGAPLR